MMAINVTEVKTSDSEKKGISKYIKESDYEKSVKGLALLFLIALFIMPQYTGIPTPVFDFTVLRIFLVLFILLIFGDRDKKNQFMDLVFRSKFTFFLIPYLIVVSYTMLFRADINAFLNPFLELVALYVVVYIFKHVYTFEEAWNIIKAFVYVMTVLGIIEYVMGETPFVHIKTISGIYTGQFIRSGQYRIMSSAVHSLGYGLILITAVPFACFDQKKKEIDIYAQPVLLILVVVNVFLTGSRSTLSVLILELFIVVLVSEKVNKKKFLITFLIIVSLLAGFLVVFHNSSFGRYVLLQITSIIDELFGTSYSVQYGANVNALSSSSNYREQLKEIYKLKWLNPVLGIGRKRSFSAAINGSYIHSVDDFYAAEYIRYAYTGLFAFVLFILYFIFGLLKNTLKKNRLSVILLVGVGCYMLNLKWVDSLQTLKYLYILLAFYLAYVDKSEIVRAKKDKRESKYIKRRLL